MISQASKGLKKKWDSYGLLLFRCDKGGKGPIRSGSDGLGWSEVVYLCKRTL